MPRLTQKDLASRAGVTVATVSLALRNHPSLPLRTCRRIQRLAERLGYRPDAQLARLMSHVRLSRKLELRSTLGLLTSYDQRSPWKSNPYLERIHSGSTARAERLGYRLEEFWLTEPAMSPARLQTILHTRGVEGLLVLGTPTWVQTLDFDFSRFACATVGYSIRAGFHRACQHQYQEMFEVLRRIDLLGYQRVGLVLSRDTDERTLYHYSSAFLRSQQRYPEKRRLPILTAEPLEFAVFGSWFDRHRPDVVIAQAPSAETYFDWIRRLGAKVPAQCGFVSLDVDPSLPVRCSGIRQEYGGVAAAAVDLVVAQLQRNERGIPAVPKVTLIEGRWIDGDTTRSLSAGFNRTSLGREK